MARRAGERLEDGAGLNAGNAAVKRERRFFSHLMLTLLTQLVAFAVAPQAHAQAQTDPLGSLVTEALHANLGLQAQRLGEQRAAADVRAARGLFLPAVEIQSRASRLDGVPNVGDLVNPAYAALNGLLGSNQFPTNLDITLPPRHDSHVSLRQ